MAHWIIEDKGFGGQVYICSHCKNSWNDLYHPTVGQWDICPWCHEKIDEEVDVAKLANALKNIADAASKIQIPTLDIKPFNVSAFQGHIDAAKERDEKIHKLEVVSGMTLDDILEKFAAGWVMVPTKYPGAKFDEELCKSQLSDAATQAGNVIQLYGKRLFTDGYITKFKFEDDTKIDFDKEPEE